MKYYYLAALTWILEILMFGLIITIPAIIYLRIFNDWFEMPFWRARCKVLELKEKKK